MMSSSLIHHCTETRHSGRLSAGNASACASTPDWPETASLIRSHRSPNTPFTRSRPHAHPSFEVKRPAQPMQSNLPAIYAAAKSP
jgi:hypothetical protein